MTNNTLAEALEQLTRPIVGIENRTGQEAFDIMSDRITRKFDTLRASTDAAAVGSIPVWDVREVEDCGHRGMKGYEVLLPDGTWTGVDAHDPEDAIATANLDWRAAHPPADAAAVAGEELLNRAELAWQRFFYPARDCFTGNTADLKPSVGLEMADCLRLTLAALGRNVSDPNGGTVPAPAEPVGLREAKEALEWYRDQMCEGFCEGFTPRICKAAMEENPTGGDCAGCRAVVALASTKSPDADGGEA